MNIHEYQAKELLQKFGAATPAGRVATTAEEAEQIARELGTNDLVVKAQVHAGRAREGDVCQRFQRRRAPGEITGRGARGCRQDARPNAGHPSDGRGGTRGQQGAGGGLRGYRAGDLFCRAARSRDRGALDRCEHGRRRGNRNGGGEIAGENHPRADRSAGWACSLFRPANWRSNSDSSRIKSNPRRSFSARFIAPSSNPIARWWK